MRLLHLIGKHMNKYIAVDKIISFEVFFDKNTRSYAVELQTNIGPTPLAIKTANPSELVENLLKTINTIDNKIIEYTIKGEE